MAVIGSLSVNTLNERANEAATRRQSNYENALETIQRRKNANKFVQEFGDELKDILSGKSSDKLEDLIKKILEGTSFDTNA